MKYGDETKRIKKYFHVLYGVLNEHIKVQEENIIYNVLNNDDSIIIVENKYQIEK